MANPPSIHVSRVLPTAGPGTLSAREARAILAVAFLAGEADGEIMDEEQDAFSELAVALRGLVTQGDPQMAEAELEQMLDELADRLDESGRAACLPDLARALERDLARDLAYKVAVAMSLADMNRSDDEADFDEVLIVALKLSEEQADILSNDVYAAIEDDEDDED